MIKVLAPFFLLTIVMIGILGLFVFQDGFLLTSGTYAFVFLSYTFFFLKLYSRKKVDLFAPPILFLLAFFLYSLGGGLFVEFRHADRSGHPISPLSVSHFYYLCILAISFYSQGVLFAHFKRVKIKSVVTIRKFNPFSLIGFSVVVSLPFFRSFISKFDFFHAKPYTDVLNGKIAFRETVSQGLVDVIFVLGPLYCVLYALVYIFFNKKYNIFYRYISLVIFAFPVLTFFIEGQRSEMVTLLIIPVLLFHYGFRKINLEKRSIVLLVFMGGFLFLGMKAMEVTRAKENIGEMIPFLKQEFDRQGWQLFSIANVGELMTSTNQIVLIDKIDSGVAEYSLGKTFFKDIFAFVPRAIWPERPLPLSEFFVYTFYPNRWKKGGGLGLFITMESYWAFGYLGTVIYFFFFGYISQAVYRLLTSKSNLFSIFLYIQFFKTFVMASTRSGILLGIKGFLMGVLVFLIYMLFVKLSSKNYKELVISAH